MRIDFPYSIRQALAVAEAVVEVMDPRKGSLLSVNLSRHADHSDYPEAGEYIEVTFRFEGGRVIQVELFDMSQYNESWRDGRQDWIVSGLKVRYYPAKLATSTGSKVDKVQEIWTLSHLRELKEATCGWHHPRVLDPDVDGVGRVCIAADTGRATTEVWVDPDYDSVNHTSVCSEFSYRRFVPGERDMVVESAEGQRKLFFSR